MARVYTIEKHDGYLLVRFKENFDYNTVLAVIHHLTSTKEYPHTNDVWVVGSHHADIHLGELETMMRDFHCRCPDDGSRTKTAIVVDPGLTESIIELWVSATRKRVPFDMRTFHALPDALDWLEVAQTQVA